MAVNTTNATSVRIKAGTNSALTTGVVFGAAVTPDGNSNSQLTITGLTAGTAYYYRIAMTNSVPSESLDAWTTVGRFTTSPSGAASFTVGFGSCLNATDSTSFSAIAAKLPNIFLHLGDEYYADGSGTTVANFRLKMDAKRTATNQKELYRVAPANHIPSDHDGMNNNTNAGSDATAWTNWNSVYREMSATTGLAGSGVYRAFTYGRVRFIALDRRSFATTPSATDNSSKTCLGATQKQWFKDQITNATEPLIIVQNPEPWIGSAQAGDDGWFGYTTERTELANFIAASGKRVAFLGGDMHAVAAEDGSGSPGGVAIFHASPFGQNGSQKGGPYDVGPYPADTSFVEQYGWLDITDTGTQISLVYKGFSSNNTQRVTLTKTYTLDPLSPPAATATAMARPPAVTDGSVQSGITVQGTVSTYESASGTLVNLTYPTGVTFGELLVAVIAHSTGTAPTTNPGGWTLGASRNSVASEGPSLSVWYRVSAGTESGDVQFATNPTAGRVTGHMFRLSGVDTTTIEDVAEQTASVNSTTLVTPSITTVTNNAMLLYSITLNASTAADITGPAEPTKIVGSTGTGRRLSVYTELKSSAGATGTRTWTANGTLPFTGITMAMRPAAAGPATVVAVPATAQALAAVPVVIATQIQAVKAIATAMANVPAVSNGTTPVTVVAVRATCNATAIVPVITTTVPANVAAVRATATAMARTVGLPRLLTAVKATATATAYAATVDLAVVNHYDRCPSHTAYIYDRGGRHQIGVLGPLSRIRWERRRDDISSATAYVATPDPSCATMLGMVHAGRHEMVIFRGNRRVWEGPIVRISFKGPSVEIEAHDVMHYALRTTMHNEYDDSYPNNGFVLDRIDRILTAEMARKEALDPPINMLPHVQIIYATPPVTDAGTAAHTLPYQYSVFQHIDEYAARGGIDYTVVGRAALFFDVNTAIGRTAAVSMDDFIGQPVITEYGMELGTNVAMTDGKGNYGEAGAVDPYYGEWEMLFQAYDEDTAAPGAAVPTVAELTSQATRSWNQSKLPPTVLRIPDNTRLNPNGVLSIDDLVPGVHIPFSCELPGRSLSQMQKLDSMSVEETATGGEVIKVTMSPAVLEGA
jgi:hypothetical protein